MTAPLIPSDLAVNLVDPLAHADMARIHGTFTELRAKYPLAKAELEGCDPFWAVTKHADILEISRQNALFLNGAMSTTFTTKAATAQVMKITGTCAQEGSALRRRHSVKPSSPGMTASSRITSGARRCTRSIADEPSVATSTVMPADSSASVSSWRSSMHCWPANCRP